MHLIEFDTLESTNRYCESLDLKQVEAFTTYWAHCQTNGLGQRGNAWHSAPWENLTFSIVLHPNNLEAVDQYNLTIQCSAAIAQCIESALRECGCDLPVYIKWPNDIYVGNRKICGTLIINELAGDRMRSAICGIGLNVNETDFPSDLPNPTSIALATGLKQELRPLLLNICNNIETTILNTPFPTVLKYYLSHLYQKGNPAQYLYHGSQITATITGINHYGHLLLTTAAGNELCCQLKEIVFL